VLSYFERGKCFANVPKRNTTRKRKKADVNGKMLIYFITSDMVGVAGHHVAYCMKQSP
jgi:hypothetical protein